MEITIDGIVYPLKASLAFLNAIEKTKHIDQGGQSMEFGLPYAVIMMQQMGDVRYLEQVLYALNTNLSPRLDKKKLDAWLEEGDVDTDALIEQVIDFLSRANVCKSKLRKILGETQTSVKA